MTKKYWDIFLGSLPFIFILLLWQIIYFLGFFPRWLLYSPYEVLIEFFYLLSDKNYYHLILTSILNLIPPFVFATIISFFFGLIIGLNKTARKIFNPLLSAFFSIPSLTWLPLIILIFGFSRTAIWLVIFWSSFLRFTYHVIGGIQNVNIYMILAAKNLGLSKFAIIFKVILPASLPHLITGLRVCFSSAWRSLIGAEMLVLSLGGLGKFIWMSQWYFQFDRMIVGILTIAFIGFLIEKVLFSKFENKTLVKWGIVNADIG